MSPQVMSLSDWNHTFDVSVQIGALSIDVKHDNKLEDKTIIAAEVMPKQTIFKGAMFIENKNKPTYYGCLMKEANDSIAFIRMKQDEYPVHVQYKVIMNKICHADQSIWWRSKSCHGCDKYASIETWKTDISYPKRVQVQQRSNIKDKEYLNPSRIRPNTAKWIRSKKTIYLSYGVRFERLGTLWKDNSKIFPTDLGTHSDSRCASLRGRNKPKSC